MPVYKELLEFYVVAIKFFSYGRMVVALMSEAVKDRLPSIADNFLYHAECLQKSIQNATAKVVSDIQRLLLDNKSMVHPGILPTRSLGYRGTDLTRCSSESAWRQ